MHFGGSTGLCSLSVSSKLSVWTVGLGIGVFGYKSDSLYPGASNFTSLKQTLPKLVARGLSALF